MQGHAGVAREGAQQELALDGLSGAPGGFGGTRNQESSAPHSVRDPIGV